MDSQKEKWNKDFVITKAIESRTSKDEDEKALWELVAIKIA